MRMKYTKVKVMYYGAATHFEPESIEYIDLEDLALKLPIAEAAVIGRENVTEMSVSYDDETHVSYRKKL